MIDKREIIEFAHEFSLSPDIVEKDYTLGWVLAGIANHPALGSQWVFKGGTCLKKCYFETYRFSEDLDFTLSDYEQLDKGFLADALGEISDWVYESSGVELPRGDIRIEIFRNPRGNISAQGRISYRGPLQRRGNLPRIKLDLTADEILVMEPVARDVYHPYADRPEDPIRVYCYSFEETFAEKIRALAERGRPRDLYDVVNIFRHDELRPDPATVLDVLKKKCSFKEIAVPDKELFENEPLRDELVADWESMLGHQLPALPPFEKYWSEIAAVFDWLYGRIEKAVLPEARVVQESNLDETWRPPSMASAWHTAIPLEPVRFAAANRLCVELTYGGTSRIIEPYSLRRTRDGNILLFAVKHHTGELRAYRVDRIQNARITQESFNPRYRVELTPAGPLFAPETTKRPSLPGSATSRRRSGRRRHS
ncbi:MAG: nucleotidyl transferase AbiEii/AbiGii toxin family protein [Thermoleophilia bacterium]|nr:nucleotidyl transferase AbiEii/AbiGii toxin family protein [Thermoleophilia bacterium]